MVSFSNIFIIGYRCTGKTTVGRLLAKQLTWRFVDTDESFVTRAEISIAKAVEQKGWDYFRQEETNILNGVCAKEKQVVATGGGVILNPKNISAMRQSGAVVWLKASPSTLIARMQADKKTPKQRPALSGATTGTEVTTVLAERTPQYRCAALFEVDTDGLTPLKIVSAICEKLNITV